MIGRHIRLIACAIFFTGAQASNLTAQVKADCDRGCLRTTLDQYLRAVIAHDPAAAPLFVAFRQTENAINVPRGEGMWKTVTGLGKVQRRFFDPVTGQAGYYGIVEEGTTLAIVTVRVRVEKRVDHAAVGGIRALGIRGCAVRHARDSHRRISSTPTR